MPHITSRLSCALFAILATATPALAQNVTESLLYSFPNSSIVTNDSFLQASDGNFYGSGPNGIYKFIPTRPGFPAPAQPFVTLHTANPGANDPGTYYGMIEGMDGNFYGSAYFNKVVNGTSQNVGQVFKLTPSGTFTTLYTFCRLAKCLDGQVPIGQIIQGSDGNLYGGTLGGGCGVVCGDGIIFRLSLSGTLTVLHSFCSLTDYCLDGYAVASAPLEASDGSFYGSTFSGGADNGGVVFKYTPAGKFSIVYSFCDGDDTGDCPTNLAIPYSRMVEQTPGTIFEFAESGSIFSFNTSGNTLDITGAICAVSYYCSDQPLPVPSSFQILASDDNLYASGSGGTYQQGLIFNQYGDAVYSFCAKTNCPDGANPGLIIQGNDGALYGSVSAGGANGFGGIFRIQPGASEASHFPPPVNVTASNYNILAGQSVTVDWKVENAISTTMQQCSSWLNGSPYGKVAPTGSLKFTPPSTGTWVPALTCGGLETGYATITVTNKPASTQTSLTASSASVAAGATVTFTALANKLDGVTAVPRGDVTFKYGARSLGTVALDPTGAASFTVSTSGIPSGNYPVTAVYNGDPGDSPSASTAVPITVTK